MPQSPAVLLQEVLHGMAHHHTTLHEVIAVQDGGDGARRSLSNPIMPCFPDETESIFSHTCFNGEAMISVDPAVPYLTPVQGCFTDNITDPLNTRVNGECGKFCIMAFNNGANGISTCSHCALLENGQFVYDCTNLFPDAACPARDFHGNCGNEEYEQWKCFQDETFGKGWSCKMHNLPNPAFLQDTISQNDIETSLACSNDITGLDATVCQDPMCSIANITSLISDNISGRCSYCKVVEQHQDDINETTTRPIFEYDCLEAFPDLKCPILLPNGECRYEPLVPPHLPENTTLWNVPSFIQEQNNDEDDLEPGWTLHHIDPTIFNVLMDVFDRIAMVLFATAVGMLYPVYLAVQLRGGKRAVQASELGHVPSDFLSAIQSARSSWNLTLPAMLLLVFVLVADFAHSIADFGLDFVTTEQQGPKRTVLQLGAEPHQRNPFPPIEIAGDPVILRTVAVTKFANEGNYEASRGETAVLFEFLRAVNLAARGGSPFVKQNRTSWRMVEGTYGNVETSFISLYVDHDASPLAEVDLEIPLDCYDVEMSKSARVTNGNPGFEEPQESTSWVPNCILTAERSSGIYGGQRMEPPQILETLENLEQIYLLEDQSIRLTNGNESFVRFQASPKSKALARDRENATEGGVRGRHFYEVDGMKVGTTSISFSNVFLASGAPKMDSFGTGGRSRNDYALVAEVNGACPSRPSGLNMGDEECLVTIVLECDRFPEDSAGVVHEVYGPELESSSCDFHHLNIAWGRNFKADAELAATVAGLYGIVRPSMFESSLRTFYHHSIFAAIFALSQVREAPSIEEVVRPRVNTSFIVFMLVPLSLAIGMFVLAIWANRRWKLPVIPTDTWQFLLLGAEDNGVLPKRQDKRASYPEVDDQLVFAGYLEDEVVPKGGNPVPEKLVYGIVRKNQNESLRRWTISTRGRPTAPPLGSATVQARQQPAVKDDSSFSDDGSSPTPPATTNGQTTTKKDSSSDKGSNPRTTPPATTNGQNTNNTNDLSDDDEESQRKKKNSNNIREVPSPKGQKNAIRTDHLTNP